MSDNFLSDDIVRAVSPHFLKMTLPVSVVVASDETPASERMENVVRFFASQSELVQISYSDDPALPRPSFSVSAPGQTPRAIFAGSPDGHEFSSALLAVLRQGGVPLKDSPEAQQAAARVPPAEYSVFFSLSCHNCPETVQALFSLSLLNPGVSVRAYDGALFPDEVARLGVMSVPSVYDAEGRLVASGRHDLASLVRELSPSSFSSPSPQGLFDMIVVGGGPAAVSSAVYTARKGLRVGLVAGRVGGQVNDTMGIDNLISAAPTTGPALSAHFSELLRENSVEVFEGVFVESLRASDPDSPVTLSLVGGASVSARTVVVASGASWRELGVPGEREYRGRGVAYCPHCDGPMFKGRPVAVAGGGNSGVEAAIDLAGTSSSVVLFEYSDQLKADAVLQRRLRELPNVSVITRSRISSVDGDGAKVSSVSYVDLSSGETRSVPVDGIFVQIGLSPATSWLSGSGVELNPRGEIVIDAKCSSSLPRVFAAGDCTDVPYKQIAISVGEGVKAALSAFDAISRGEA